MFIFAPGTSLSAGGPGRASSSQAPVGSPQPRPSAGVFVPSAPINIVVKKNKGVQTSLNKKVFNLVTI
jgi:hypothetical protein